MEKLSGKPLCIEAIYYPLLHSVHLELVKCSQCFFLSEVTRELLFDFRVVFHRSKQLKGSDNISCKTTLNYTVNWPIFFSPLFQPAGLKSHEQQLDEHEDSRQSIGNCEEIILSKKKVTTSLSAVHKVGVAFSCTCHSLLVYSSMCGRLAMAECVCLCIAGTLVCTNIYTCTGTLFLVCKCVSFLLPFLYSNPL